MSTDGGTTFPETNWRMVLEARSPGSASLGSLIARYWKPACAYIRRIPGMTAEEAEDLTQEFFTGWVEGRHLPGADPRRGSFRGYLVTALRNLVCNRRRDLRARKRGGGRRTISLAWAGEDRFEATPPAAEAMDLALLRKILLEAGRRVEEELHAQGRGLLFDLFRKYDLDRARNPDLSYEDMASAAGLSPGEVRHCLRYARAAFRRKVLQCIPEFLGDGRSPAAVLREILG